MQVPEMTDVTDFTRGFAVVNQWELTNMCGERMRTWNEHPNTYLRNTENLWTSHGELAAILAVNLRRGAYGGPKYPM